MAVILIKRADSDGKPIDGNLARGELAYAFGTGTDTNEGQRLFVGVPNGGSSRTAIIGGEYFTQFLDHTPGTLTASSAIITDASNKIDQLKVDVLTLDSNVISTSSDNLVLNPSTGIVSIGNLEFESNEIRTTSANETLIINPYPSADSGTVIIKGNLRVDGTTTTVNSTEVTINDLAIVLGDSAGTNKIEFDGAGIIVFDADANAVFGATSPSITYDGTNDRWNFSRAINVDSAIINNAIISNTTFTDSALSQFLDSDDFVFSSGQASLKAESIQDVVGAMVSTNTETNITVTYQDVDGTIDFEVPTATTAQVGVAQFDSDEFNVVAGFVTIDTVDGGTY